MSSVDQASTTTPFRSVFDLAKQRSLRRHEADAFDRIFEVKGIETTCRVGRRLATKYGVLEDNAQFVVSIRNRRTFEQTWFNAEHNGKSCDFCDALNLTAVDDFGRVQRPRVISGSNLFKCCGPGHGLLVFQKHHPLEFDQEHIQDLMLCTQEWMNKAASLHTDALFPLFVWNCLARAGASQFHGHAQVMLSPVPFPCYEVLSAAEERHSQVHENRKYLNDLLDAHRELGLVIDVDSEVGIYPSITPWKDMDVVILTSSIEKASFHKAFYTTLKVLMEDFGMQTFNVGIQGIPLNGHTRHTSVAHTNYGCILTRIVSRGKISSQASDFGGLEVVGGASIGHTDPFDITYALRNRFQQH